MVFLVGGERVPKFKAADRLYFNPVLTQTALQKLFHKIVSIFGRRPSRYFLKNSKKFNPLQSVTTFFKITGKFALYVTFANHKACSLTFTSFFAQFHLTSSLSGAMWSRPQSASSSTGRHEDPMIKLLSEFDSNKDGKLTLLEMRQLGRDLCIPYGEVRLHSFSVLL